MPGPQNTAVVPGERSEGRGPNIDATCWIPYWVPFPCAHLTVCSGRERRGWSAVRTRRTVVGQNAAEVPFREKGEPSGTFSPNRAFLFAGMPAHRPRDAFSMHHERRRYRVPPLNRTAMGASLRQSGSRSEIAANTRAGHARSPSPLAGEGGAERHAHAEPSFLFAGMPAHLPRNALSMHHERRRYGVPPLNRTAMGARPGQDAGWLCTRSSSPGTAGASPPRPHFVQLVSSR